MSELRRLRESDPEWRELLRYTRAEATPSVTRVDALAARVVAGLSAPGAAGTSSIATTQSSLWLFGAALVVLLGFGALRLRQDRDPPRAAEPTAVAAPSSVSAPATSPEPMARPEPAAPEEAPRAPAPRVQQRPARQASKPSRPATQTERTNPTEEIALLKGARRVLMSDPQRSLELVEQHQREHPAGVFAEEREALAVEALWRADERERAAQRLRAMLARYPRSTYRERLTDLLADP